MPKPNTENSNCKPYDIFFRKILIQLLTWLETTLFPEVFQFQIICLLAEMRVLI